MFIPLFGGMIIGMVVDTGRSAYQLCIPFGIGAQLFSWTMVTGREATLFSMDVFWGCLINMALAMLSVFLIRWQMGRRE